MARFITTFSKEFAGARAAIAADAEAVSERLRTWGRPLSWMWTAVGAWDHAIPHLALVSVCIFLAWPIFGSDFPPGVDSPTFLHLSWVSEQAIRGRLESAFVDPYWYGGFPYLKAYPPLGYGLVGLISAVTTLGVGAVYGVFMVLSLVLIGTGTYWLGLEMGLRRLAATGAALAAVLAYPTLGAVFLWGWFTSLFALGLALFALGFLLKALRVGNVRYAVVSGVLFALVVLTHHMTAFAFGFALAVSSIVMVALQRKNWRPMLKQYAVVVGVALVISGPWVALFTLHLLDVGFRREIPGNWIVPLTDWRRNALNAEFIGIYWYPSYLGAVLIPAAVVGLSFALRQGVRWVAIAVLLLVFTLFSFGAATVPLYRAFPFSGMDVARFPVYMAPFLGLMVACGLQGVERLIQASWPHLKGRVPSVVVVVGLFAVVFLPMSRDASRARASAHPYKVATEVKAALSYVQEKVPPANQGENERLFTIGFWTWGSFLAPYLTDRPLADGWADEGAASWREVRQLRYMSWSGQVDAMIAHSLLRQLGVRWVVVYDSYPLEHPVQWADAMRKQRELFNEGPTWGPVTTFRVQQ
ncbi:MAG: hypothetical protein EXR47_08010 [Dehalococcoidia bacterium]|nr:hypothetical protein [Dehalococcoidia bacterium]